MRLFRFKIDTWTEEFGTDNEKGFIVADNYGDAANKLEKYCTDPNGHCELGEMKIEEIAFDDEMLLDNDIDEIRKAENEKGGK